MPEERVVIVDSGIITAYGRGLDCCWDGLRSDRSMICPVTRFGTSQFISNYAATLPDLAPAEGRSLVMTMLEDLRGMRSFDTPGDADLILATTVGEIDILERAVLDGSGDASGSDFDALLGKVASGWRVNGSATVVSSACASSTIAIAVGADAIRTGRTDCVLVIGCDCVSEFVFAGFSALGALDGRPARPFDADRAGLSLGEAVGYVLLMSHARSALEGRPAQCDVVAWSMSSDAEHMTRPTQSGRQLARAMGDAIARAGASPADVSAVCAHGTGTPYNDAMEMAALKALFDRPAPTFSVKGGIGHTLGAAGLVETVLSARVLRERSIPPTINTETIAPEAVGWIDLEARDISDGLVLTTNSGFGGVNACLLLGRGE